MSKFIGFDEPELNDNFFELFRDGKPYLSLYHDCRVEHLSFPEDENFNLHLVKVFDSGHGPAVGSKLLFSCKDAQIYSVNATYDGNFEDVDEVVYLGDISKERIKLKLMVSGIEFYIECGRVELLDSA